MSPLVREFCERHGYPYRSFGWGEAMWKVLILFRHPKAPADGLQPPKPH